MEKFKVLFLVYNSMLSVWITNSIVERFGFNLKTVNTMDKFFDMLLSPFGILVFFSFIFSFVFLSFYGKVLIMITNNLSVYLVIAASWLIAFLKRFCQMLIFRKPFTMHKACIEFEDVKRLIDDSPQIKKMVVDIVNIYDDSELIESTNYFFCFFFSLWIILNLYEMIDLVPYLEKVIKSLIFIYFFNANLVFWIVRNKAKVKLNLQI